MPLAIAAMAVAFALPGPAAAAPAGRSAILPPELASADVLPVSRHKTFIVPRLSTDRVLVFAPYSVNDYRGGWTRSQSHSSRSGSTESVNRKAERSFSFTLHGGSTQLQAECDEHAEGAATRERGEAEEPLVPDYSLRCTLYAAGGPFELSAINGRGELVGTAGERFAVSAIVGAASRWEPPFATGMLLHATPAGEAVAAVDFSGKGRVVLAHGLQPPARDVLAAAAAALLLGDLTR